jgi:hypothetical protein
MTNDVDIKLLGDEQLMQAFNNLEYKVSHKVLKKTVNDTARKVFVPPMRKAHPYRQIQKSIGVKQGRSRRVAAAFAGPRMIPRRFQTDKQKASGNYSGWLAQIVEYNKGAKRSTSKGYNRGIMPLQGRGRMRTTLKRNLIPAERHVMKSLRTIIEREWKRAVKKGLA